MAIQKLITQNLWCVGRNYKKHAEELGNKIPTSPLIFLKSGACLNFSKTIELPDFSKDIHHECELFIKLNEKLLPESFGLALDLTARDTQELAKKNGTPWTLSKSFKGSAPISEAHPFVSFQHLSELQFTFSIDDKVKQMGHVKDMIFDCETLLNHIKQYFPVQPGDILFTGTPEGVGQLHSGQQLKAQIHGFKEVTWIVK